jgi:hypothetical protein
VGEEDYRWPELQRLMREFSAPLYGVLWQARGQRDVRPRGFCCAGMRSVHTRASAGAIGVPSGAKRNPARLCAFSHGRAAPART